MHFFLLSLPPGWADHCFRKVDLIQLVTEFRGKVRLYDTGAQKLLRNKTVRANLVLTVQPRNPAQLLSNAVSLFRHTCLNTPSHTSKQASIGAASALASASHRNHIFPSNFIFRIAQVPTSRRCPSMCQVRTRPIDIFNVRFADAPSSSSTLLPLKRSSAVKTDSNEHSKKHFSRLLSAPRPFGKNWNCRKCQLMDFFPWSRSKLPNSEMRTETQTN